MSTEISPDLNEHILSLIADGRAGEVTLPRNKEGWSLLRVAVFVGNAPLVRILLDAGADVNQTDHLGWTVLQVAALMNDDDMFVMLEAAGGIWGESGALFAFNKFEESAMRTFGGKDLRSFIKDRRARNLRRREQNLVSGDVACSNAILEHYRRRIKASAVGASGHDQDLVSAAMACSSAILERYRRRIKGSAVGAS